MSFIQLGSGYGFLNKNPVRILNITTKQTHLIHNPIIIVCKIFWVICNLTMHNQNGVKCVTWLMLDLRNKILSI
jgi:hypothetical protein